MLVVFCSCKTNYHNQPDLVSFNTDTLDIGTLKKGGQKYFDVLLFNKGNTSVGIKKVVSTCNCTVFDTTAISLGPNSTHVLRGSFEAKPNETGVVFGSIAMRTDNPEDRLKYLVVRASIL